MTYAERIGVYLIRMVTKIYHPKFGKFLHLEEIKRKIFKAVKRKEESFPELVISYVSTAFFIPIIILENLRWDYVILLFSLASSQSVPKLDIPLLKPSVQKDKKEPWDYEGRGYSMYIHIIASAYGWTDKHINNLEIDTALALVQEIITDTQLDREFLWSMSDNSYIYNAKTNTGKPNPLERPYFMNTEVKPPEKTKILRSMLPVGASSGKVSEEFRQPSLAELRGMNDTQKTN